MELNRGKKRINLSNIEIKNSFKFFLFYHTDVILHANYQNNKI